MVSVSREAPAETEERLGRVLGAAELRVLPGAWSFFESPPGEPPVLDDEVLAVVRDETSWSALRPSRTAEGPEERFGVFSFHFQPDVDNSGFVGWLASALKAELGTGVLVVCGSDRERGGVYDYWGCPEALLDDAVAVVRRLGAPAVGA